MESVFHYHTLEEAEAITRTYSSWIGKRAHVGRGVLQFLKRIVVRSGREIRINEKIEQGYYLEFEFENKILNVYEFTIGNGLMPITGTLSALELKTITSRQLHDYIVNNR